MSDTPSFTKACFWKCALQVNPSSYIKYHGETQVLTEEEYNRQLAEICRSEGIKVVGIADHGNVEGVNTLRAALNDVGVVVFPGFEIASSEKVHFVCLFPEETTTAQLDRYLGSLDLLDPEHGVQPSKLGGEVLLKKIEELGGVAYAAHCVDDSGLLRGKFNHIWKSPSLKAVQIKGTLDDLRELEGGKYFQILSNRNSDYRREHPVALLNAKDVDKPETLRDPSASCLVRMTRPCFESFKQAFLEPESGIRLQGDRTERYFSAIEKIRFTGGYLDGLEADLSENLNAVIGGRGTGKSTLIECLRYAFDLKPLSKNAQKSHDEILKTNLGRSGQIEVILHSATMNGRRFRIRRKHGEAPIVHESDGIIPASLSSFTPLDLLPRLEIYGQNEIYEIAQDSAERARLLARFLGSGNGAASSRFEDLKAQLLKNRQDIHSVLAALQDPEADVARLPKLQEQATQFASLGLEEKLKAVPLWEREKQLSARFRREIQGFSEAVRTLREAIPDPLFLSETALQGLPHAAELASLRERLLALTQAVTAPIDSLNTLVRDASTLGDEPVRALDAAISKDEATLSKSFSEIPSVQGRSGREIGEQYRTLQEDIARVQPKVREAELRKKILTELQVRRKELLAERSTLSAECSAERQRAAKSLNRRLEGNLKVSLNPEADRSGLEALLDSFRMEGVREKRLEWIREAGALSATALASAIREGADALRSKGWGMTETVINALCRVSEIQIMQIEETVFADSPVVELNVGHEGTPSYRSIESLSKGQQCTAILHLLLLRNQDPLVLDQPEDNLDNAFIADRIVSELRKAKFERQFLFATHNANIPVFGNAEWIGVFQSQDGSGNIPKELQGAIDLPEIQRWASDLLEGGKAAFMQRKNKYHF
jgi:energy-coupling factor transporter ATP-binding protein EcfA2